MKKSLYSSAIILAAASLLSACSSSTTITTQEQLDREPAPAYVAVHHTVLFEFDSYQAPEEIDLIIQPHVDYLMKHPERSILLQGQTDKVGHADYNYILGQRRAMTVKQAFLNAGIPESQLKLSSIASASSSRRAQPRAVHIVY